MSNSYFCVGGTESESTEIDAGVAGSVRQITFTAYDETRNRTAAKFVHDLRRTPVN